MKRTSKQNKPTTTKVIQNGDWMIILVLTGVSADVYTCVNFPAIEITSAIVFSSVFSRKLTMSFRNAMRFSSGSLMWQFNVSIIRPRNVKAVVGPSDLS